MYPVLVVDDEAPIAELISLTLSQIGLPCVQAHSGSEAADLIETRKFDLILLDVMLPDVDGFELMDYIRPTGTPVIFLTARTAVDDRVRGLKLGAYDYIVKPFAPDELLARVDGLMRHTGRRSAGIRLWDVEINPDTRTVTRAGSPVPLTPREFDLLMVLVRNRGVTVYRDALFEQVWGMEEIGMRTLNIHISRLRKKLGWDARIRTVPKIGYRLEAGEEDP